MRFAEKGSSPLPYATPPKFCGKKSAEFVQDFETIILCDFLARFQKFF